MHVRRIGLGQTYHASPATPLTAVQWKWRERGALPRVILVVLKSKMSQTGKKNCKILINDKANAKIKIIPHVVLQIHKSTF